jgi:hypothetical protein
MQGYIGVRCCSVLVDDCRWINVARWGFDVDAGGEQFPTFRGPSEFDKGMNRMHVGAIDNPDRAGRSNTTGEVDAVAGPAGVGGALKSG